MKEPKRRIGKTGRLFGAATLLGGITMWSDLAMNQIEIAELTARAGMPANPQAVACMLLCIRRLSSCLLAPSRLTTQSV